jgi:hypothetical protein
MPPRGGIRKEELRAFNTVRTLHARDGVSADKLANFR